MRGPHPTTEVDLERGESDVDESLVPEILAGYYTTPTAPTEVSPEKNERLVETRKKKRPPGDSRDP